MSQFRIYQVNHFDPKYLGIKMRRIVVYSAIISPIFVFVFALCLKIFKINVTLLYTIWAPAIICFYLFLNFLLKSNLKNIKTIGEIEFTRTSIKKRIGDSFTVYEFCSIKKIDLDKHFPTVSISSSYSDNFTYILKIIFINSTSESLVVSDKPIDSKLKISIVETMKTLKKISPIEITINT
jgi:hypothetical protein